MSVVTSLSEQRATSLASIRAEGRLSARFARTAARTTLADLRESGGYRLKFPRGSQCEAVIVNTGGGVAGGDDVRFEFAAAIGAHVTLTSQAAEKIYRSDDQPVVMQVNLQAETDAIIEWLPQETILFDGAALERSFHVDLAQGADALIFESVVFGRLAMGEQIRHGSLRDHWRIRQAGRLLFADEVRLDGALDQLLARPAVLAGAKATATIILVRPDAAVMRDQLRVHQWDGVESGFSVVNGLFIGRLLAHDPLALRRAARSIIEILRGSAMPRVFTF